VSCKTDIVTRFGVGHGNKQVHAFPCPKCGVPITCVMRLDQEKGAVAFDPPVNADWVDVTESFPAPVFVTFHPEILEHRSAFQTDGASPFVTAVHNFADYKEYGKHESMRMLVRTRYWETIKRAAVHYERQQWEFWENEVRTVLGDEPKSSYEDRLKQMFECFDFSVRFFTLERIDIWKTAGEQFADATFRHNKPLTEFVEVLRTSGRLMSLWRQLNALHDDFISTYHIWMPVLQLRYWKYKPSNLKDLMVSDKRFDELKPIYLNAFELLARLSVVALGVALIRGTGSTDVPTKKGSMSIWDFEAMDNANKVPHLAKYGGTTHFSELMDTKLRNGIGHNAAHYDVATDEVVCVKAKGATLTEWRISYTEFCYTMLELVSAAYFSEAFLREALRRTAGLNP
jgi:hypothetical protein